MTRAVLLEDNVNQIICFEDKMKKSFGQEFIIVNDTRQRLNKKLFYGDWIHLATVKRGLKEYMG